MLPPKSEELECVICFESIKETTILPCSCKVDYCMRCWSKALACSFNDSGHAKCPTCRGRVRVDFDSDTIRLVFSRDDRGHSSQDTVDDMEAHLREMWHVREETIERLAQQAMPAQVRILEEYGKAHPAKENMLNSLDTDLHSASVSKLKMKVKAFDGKTEDCLEKSDLVNRLLMIASREDLLATMLVEKCAAPMCVCGCTLVLLHGEDRMRRALKPQLSDADIEQYIERMKELRRNGITNQMDSIICDLCDESVQMSSSNVVWTCESGNDTILHATSYDICNRCFIRHSFSHCEGITRPESDLGAPLDAEEHHSCVSSQDLAGTSALGASAAVETGSSDELPAQDE